jgi:hypothetical protein
MLSSSMGVEGGSEGYAQVTRLWARGLIWNQRHRLIIKLQTCAFAQGKDQRTLCGCEGANFLLPVCWLPAGFSLIEATTPPRSRTPPFAQPYVPLMLWSARAAIVPEALPQSMIPFPEAKIMGGQAFRYEGRARKRKYIYAQGDGCAVRRQGMDEGEVRRSRLPREPHGAVAGGGRGGGGRQNKLGQEMAVHAARTAPPTLLHRQSPWPAAQSPQRTACRRRRCQRRRSSPAPRLRAPFPPWRPGRHAGLRC